MNNVYREAFVFECAEKERKFYLPEEESKSLQFLYIDDLCKIINSIIDKKLVGYNTIFHDLRCVLKVRNTNILSCIIM